MLSQNPVVIAHRGASGYAPENTLSSFKKAVEMRAFIIETDIHQTKDSVLVIMHDETVDRTTNGTGAIKDMLYADFKKLKIRYNDLITEEHPPSLEEAIDCIDGKSKLLIELKKASNYYPNIEKHVVELLKKYKSYTDIFIIHSFESLALSTVYERDKTITLQKLLVFKFSLERLFFNRQKLKDEFKDVSGINVYARFCSKRVVKRIHALNKTVYVWTVNKPRKAKRFVKRGVDGIISNYPDILDKK